MLSKITYGGEETTFKVNVKDYVTKIEVVPADVTGKYNDELSQILVAVLGIMIFIFFILVAIFIILKIREKQQNQKNEYK